MEGGNYGYFIKRARETRHTPCKNIENGSGFFEAPSIVKKERDKRTGRAWSKEKRRRK